MVQRSLARAFLRSTWLVGLFISGDPSGSGQLEHRTVNSPIAAAWPTRRINGREELAHY